MVARVKHILFFAGALLLLGSCSDSQPAGAGPIVLGDSTTIINETDHEQLRDLVTDLQPVIPPAENKDEESTQAAADSQSVSHKPPKPEQETTQQPAATQTIPSGPGLKAEFKEVTVAIPGLNVKQGGKLDLQRANGAVYSLLDGKINGATLRVTGTIIKVSQRYQSVVVMNTDMGDLVLDALTLTAKWDEIKGNNGVYPIKGLDTKSIEFYDADGSDIRNAVQRAAKRRRINRKKVQELENSVRHLKSADQKPLSPTVRSVMWKIDGKDERGKMYSKQIRIDIPM